MLPFISRHIPTAAQAATVEERFGTLVCTDPIVFAIGRVVDQLMTALIGYDDVLQIPHPAVPKIVAGVFPGWALLELLRAGWTVVEFQNEPSARARGTFVCLGAFVHTYAPDQFGSPDQLRSEFLPCPISAQEQEDGPLLSGLRAAFT